MEKLSEFLVLREEAAGTSSASPEVMVWDVNGTKELIDKYKKYRKQVGTFKIRSIKQMWKVIAEELTHLLKRNITERNCENRWRVLDRNYKKYIEAKNSTGSGRKYFEYSTEMEELYANKRNIHPEILLASDTIVQEQASTTESDTIGKVKEPSVKETIRPKKRKISILEQIRQDRLDYQKKRLEQEERKIALLERKVLILEKQYEDK